MSYLLQDIFPELSEEVIHLFFEGDEIEYFLIANFEHYPTNISEEELFHLLNEMYQMGPEVLEFVISSAVYRKYTAM